ncbi:rhodanese-like domain-containing protein [Minwuia thermotolerans]|uniref:Rhodanese n=1 Tax=Minwuia thermotolerans TaxID=2056226 RepID=A0A2M9G5Y8_9PROT|nr:rhodanese-like domain-containing protein [Minwuia thermotolerans]ANK82264.1 MAG: rhodanese [Rhizobiales bacterium NRL2]PJK31128.1 rhodanese [Minwuia thermotolerans]
MPSGVNQMVDDAMARVETISVDDAKELVGKDGVTIVDIRDVRELWRDGKIPGAYHAPRGMLEFWIAEDSPYTKDVFQTGNRFVFYCAAGARSALATDTAMKLGLTNVCHIGGGFGAWKKAGNEIEAVEKK